MTSPITNSSAAGRLVSALKEANAPLQMIMKAREGYYGDFTSDLAMPITTLVLDAKLHGLNDIANRAMNGEFDGR
jgi:hypothetical protein